MAAAGEAVARLLGARLDQLCEWSPRRPAPCFWASEHLAQARRDSPKRDPVVAPRSSFEPSPRRRGSAWARTSRLSVGLGETVMCLVAYLLSYAWNCLGKTATIRCMYWCMNICLMGCYICVTWFMN